MGTGVGRCLTNKVIEMADEYMKSAELHMINDLQIKTDYAAMRIAEM